MSIFEKLFGSIQARLLAVLLLITLLTVAIVILFNQWLLVQLAVEADNTLLGSATQLADRIDEFNRSNKQTFSVGARLPDLVAYLEADEETRRDVEFRERVLTTLDSLDIVPWDEYYVLSQAILDGNGRNILDTAEHNIGANESEAEYFRATLLGGSVNISPIQYRPELSGIYYFYAVPLRQNFVPNTVIGVLRIQISVASVQNIVFDRVRGQDLHVAIFDQNYVRIVDTDHENLLFRSIASFSPAEIADLRNQYALPPLPDDQVSVPVPRLMEILSDSRRKPVATGFTAPGAGTEERIAVVRLETTPWYLVVFQPKSQFYETVEQQTTGILLLAFTLTIMALLSSYAISRRITRPIRTLTAVAEQVAEGNLHIKALVTSRDDVGKLATTFNLMTTELEQAHAMLEERVRQRTQELSEANDKLKHEIVERQRYEKQALDLALEHERRRILLEFIQNASHEFKTPLSIINTNSYLVKRLLPNERHSLVYTIEEQSRYIEGLINRMVLMSRLDSGVTPPRETLFIDDFLRTICAGLADVFAEKKAAAHLDLQAPEAQIVADFDLLHVAVQNLLDNALRYSGEGVNISVSTRAGQGAVTIIIEDDGIGIPANLHARVFERFFRVDEAHSTHGFGLGLAIAKRIVEILGGTIELESAVGKGTAVTIRLNLVIEAHAVVQNA